MVAIPCFNEAGTIGKVVGDFRRVLPGAQVCVFDNNSTDQSAAIARKAGAKVALVRQQGKGNVMHEIFDQAECDQLIVVDGDDTYCAEDTPRLLQIMAESNCDMLVGNRLNPSTAASFKRLNLLGNHLIAAAINLLFGTDHHDVLSGYRVFSQRFIKRIAVLTSGFETEIELTLRALEEKLVIREAPIAYRPRPADSRSKLKPFRDGFRIMITVAIILRDIYPIRLYGLISLICLICALSAAVLRILNYFGTVTLPNPVLTGLLLIFIPLGVITFGTGLILSAVNTRFAEIKQIILRNK